MLPFSVLEMLSSGMVDFNWLCVSRRSHPDCNDRLATLVRIIFDQLLGNLATFPVMLEEEEVVDLRDNLDGEKVHDTLHDF